MKAKVKTIEIDFDDEVKLVKDHFTASIDEEVFCKLIALMELVLQTRDDTFLEMTGILVTSLLQDSILAVQESDVKH